MPSRLTPREVQCVQLAGERLSNDEIATRLGIGTGTVSQHLKSAYRKLGVSGRRAAFKVLSQDGSPPRLGIAETAGPTSTQAVSPTAPVVRDGGTPKRPWSLYGAYRGLGAWRVPRPVWGSQLPIMMAFALAGLVVLVVAAGLGLVITSVLNTAGERLLPPVERSDR